MVVSTVTSLSPLRVISCLMTPLLGADETYAIAQGNLDGGGLV